MSLPAGGERDTISEEQQAKINEVRKLIGPLTDKSSIYCSNANISRYLKARHWNVKKAVSMLKESLEWRADYKPEEIRWDDVAQEAETGKMYRSNHVDKHGRTVLVMRPSCQNSNSTKDQINYLVYSMENAILNLPTNQEQVVWLVDFKGFGIKNVSLKAARESAHVLQNYYPERLGIALLYNPPKFFEPLWRLVKPFLEPETRCKVKFLYSDDLNSKKILEDVFDMDHLESAFGGHDNSSFDINKYAERMREDDKKNSSYWTRNPLTAVPETGPSLDSLKSDSTSHDSDNGN